METVCVIFGGVSTEHLISQRSAYNIIKALRKAGYNISLVGITKMGEWLAFEGEDEAVLDGSWEDLSTEKSFEKSVVIRGKGVTIQDFLISVIGNKPDLIFPAVHGINCEDGTLQGMLELSKIPYVGCDVVSSAMAMNKLYAKQIFKSVNIPQCKYVPIERSLIGKDIEKAAKRAEEKIGYPCFLKPNSGGSSVGTYVAKNFEELKKYLIEACAYDSIVLVEEFIDCREIEAAVLGNENPRIAKIGEIVNTSESDYYDYQTKYFDPDGAVVVIPAALDEEQTKKIRRYAKKAFKALGCSGLARVDFFIDKKNGDIMINEVNTLPGFTPISLFPKAWEISGMPIEKLVKQLCELAHERSKATSRLEIL